MKYASHFTDEIWQMKHFAEEDLGLEFRFDALINPRYDCSQSPLKVRLSPLDVVKMDLLDPKRVAEWIKFSTQFGGPPESVEETRRLWRCGGGLNNFAIDPYGMCYGFARCRKMMPLICVRAIF